ncbi:MOSC domain-containing protein [Ornithinimicrobium faecis]|uniref:MOSC domain-containing protein n=1 Tax=Ornithinimicrobium faecis TaxID=2934158 RepID=UPI0021175C8D|nr:MOSC domain-containing protein [Ornithinimicrobium sp. HY1745]
MGATVVAVHRSSTHSFSKPTVAEIELLEGLGVRGDAHSGTTVKHRSRVRADPDQPNLRQVHLLHAELFDHLATVGHQISPGDFGENITTRGIALLDLPVGTRLTIGEAVITVTGLRNPCQQINDFQPGLLKHVLRTDDDGTVVRLTGVMGIVSRSGLVRADDGITVVLPPEPRHRLTRV